MENEEDFGDDTDLQSFEPDTEKLYYVDDKLSIETENGLKTMKISQWLQEDPVTFDRLRKKINLKITNEIFNILVSKLRANHPEYFRDALGLNTRIRMKGYDYPVKANIPYKDRPLEFYKWWCSNPCMVSMTLAEKIRLFDSVRKENKDALLKEHRKLIDKA
jgi:ATP-dependent DNA helicase RecQ